jgi:hypothetical protein
MTNKQDVLDQVLQGLMRRYSERVPNVQRIINLLIEHHIITSEDDIENDHIAFRTLGVEHLGVQSLEKIFRYYGYQKRDHYYFAEKKLDAWWYSPPVAGYPRIFISELRVKDLPPGTQQIIRRYTGHVHADPVDALNLDDAVAVDHFLHSSAWPVPLYADYEALAAVSEYAAWTIYNKYFLNHFTISIHNLGHGYHTCEAFNAFLEKHHIQLNDAGGKVKVSRDGALKQSSTVAEKVLATFGDGIQMMIPGSYVEFAERLVLPQFEDIPAGEIQWWHRRDGFETANADKIFESTYRSQTGRPDVS